MRPCEQILSLCVSSFLTLLLVFTVLQTALVVRGRVFAMALFVVLGPGSAIGRVGGKGFFSVAGCTT